jgi:single-strand DNA-binding protein
VLWRQENVAQYLTKGRQVYIEGRISTRSYDDKEGRKVWTTEVVVDELILLGGRGEAAPPQDESWSQPSGQPVSMPRSAPRPQQRPADPPEPPAITDDDVPF